MKSKITALMLCFMSISMSGQEINVVSEKFPFYQGIVTSNLSAVETFTRSKMWIAETFKSANDVIQYEDINTATIIAKGNTNIGRGLNVVKVHFTLKIEGKENRFRYTIEITDMTGASGQAQTQSIMYFYRKSEKYSTWVTEEFKSRYLIWIHQILSTHTTSTDDEW